MVLSDISFTESPVSCTPRRKSLHDAVLRAVIVRKIQRYAKYAADLATGPRVPLNNDLEIPDDCPQTLSRRLSTSSDVQQRYSSSSPGQRQSPSSKRPCPTSKRSSPTRKKVKKVCRKCPYAHCCRSYAQVHRAHSQFSLNIPMIFHCTEHSSDEDNACVNSCGGRPTSSTKTPGKEASIAMTKNVEQFVELVMHHLLETVVKKEQEEFIVREEKKKEREDTVRHGSPRRLLRSTSLSDESDINKKSGRKNERKSSLDSYRPVSPKLKRNALSWAVEGLSSL